MASPFIIYLVIFIYKKQLVHFYHLKYIIFGIFIISYRISFVNINIIFKNIFIFVNFAAIFLIKLPIHHCFYSIIYKFNNFYTLIFTLYIYGIKKENSRQNMRTI